MEISRITNEQYDERFYYSKEKINPRTGTHWFPSYHFLMSVGAPVSNHLVEWWKNYGHEADRILKQKEVRGSWVHDRIEMITKFNQVVTQSDIEAAWGNNPSDMLFVQRALTGFFNFLNEEQAQVVSSERMILGEDWGGTMDLELRLKSDNYANLWIIDIKTAKSVYNEHLQQVEAYRRVTGADKAGVLILGNSTRKRYTFTAVVDKHRDHLYELFLAEKETAYKILTKENRLQPTEETFPKEYSMNLLKIGE